jgi:hypothetical protein
LDLIFDVKADVGEGVRIGCDSCQSSARVIAARMKDQGRADRRSQRSCITHSERTFEEQSEW